MNTLNSRSEVFSSEQFTLIINEIQVPENWYSLRIGHISAPAT